MSDKVRKALGWIFTPIYLPLFWGILCAFHIPQVIANLFGRAAQIKVLEWMNLCLLLNFRTAGTRVRFEGRDNLPLEGPAIFVSNHQSMYDIPMILWNCRRLKPKFISKKELGRGIPSISFALRHMGSVLIDRGNTLESLQAIMEFGERMHAGKMAACIFPEGTRARDGVMKKFKTAGFMALARSMPDAPVIPMAMQGSWEMLRYNFKPVPFGVHLTLSVLEPIQRGSMPDEEILKLAESRIREKVDSLARHPQLLTTEA